MELHDNLHIFGERERDIFALLDDFKNAILLPSMLILGRKTEVENTTL